MKSLWDIHLKVKKEGYVQVNFELETFLMTA